MAEHRISGDLAFQDGATKKSLIGELGKVNTAITTEASRATAAEQANARAIDTETTRATGAEQALSARISTLEAGTVVYGVRIDTTNPNPSTAVTYTDDAVGMSAASGNKGDYKAGDLDGCFPWNKIKPCLFKDGAVVGYLTPNDFTKFEGGDVADITSGSAGDVMIEIPHFWYKIGRVGIYLEVKVSNTALPGFTDYAFSYKGAVKDRFYVGAYLGFKDDDEKLRSLSGKVVTGSQTIGQFRTAAQANGAGYEQLCFNKLTALQILFVIQFGGLNSQLALGAGYTMSNSTHAPTGGTNANGMNYGETTGKLQCKFNGIEDFFGNFYQWVDGYVSASNLIKIADGNFNDTGANYEAVSYAYSSNGGYLRDVAGDNKLAFTPKTFGGSSTTYYSDSANLSSGCLPIFGGNRSNGAYAGAFYFIVSVSASYSSSYYGARLLYCG